MLTAKSIAIAGYHRVFEDGPALTPTGCPEGISDHGCDYSDSEMLTTDMMDGDRKPVSPRATLSTEQANRLRKQGRAGRQDTVSGAEREDV
jgi:hypothetical protein